MQCVLHRYLCLGSPVLLLLGQVPALGQDMSDTVVNATLASQYVSRGLRQSWGKPALQASVDYVNPNGWSLGAWSSSISNRLVENGSIECDLYGGYTGMLGTQLAYSMQAYYYIYPGAQFRATATTYNYGELVAGLKYSTSYVKYYHTVTREFFGIENARNTGYIDIGSDLDLGSGYGLALHGGSGRLAGAGNDVFDWRDIKIGISKIFVKGWSSSVAYTRAWGKTDAYAHYTLGIPNSAGVVEQSDLAKGTVVVSLIRTF